MQAGDGETTPNTDGVGEIRHQVLESQLGTLHGPVTRLEEERLWIQHAGHTWHHHSLAQCLGARADG
eukprot:327307-Rhodomonas_salina.2